MIKEMGWYVARSGREEGDRRTPLRWVRIFRSDVLGNRMSEETPHSKAILVPQMSKYASVMLVEIMSEALLTRVRISTAIIRAYVACTCSANQLARNRPIGSSRQGATRTRMEGISVRSLIVGTFDDVDLP